MAETTSPDKAEEEIVEHLKKLGVGNPELATKELLEKIQKPASSVSTVISEPAIPTTTSSSIAANTSSSTELPGPSIIEALYCKNTSRIVPDPSARKFLHQGLSAQLLKKLGKSKDPKYPSIKPVRLSHGSKTCVVYIRPNVDILYLPNMHNLNIPRLVTETCNKRAITAIAVIPFYITNMTRNSAMYHMAMLPKLKTVYAVDGREVAYEWLAVDRSVNWDIKFEDLPEGEHKPPPRAPYNRGYAAVVRAKWNEMMAPEIAAGKAPELVFKIVERKNLDEPPSANESGITIIDAAPPEQAIINGEEVTLHTVTFEY